MHIVAKTFEIYFLAKISSTLISYIIFFRLFQPNFFIELIVNLFNGLHKMLKIFIEIIVQFFHDIMFFFRFLCLASFFLA